MEAQRAAAIEKAVTASGSDLFLRHCPSTGGSRCSKGDAEAGETTAGLGQLPSGPSILGLFRVFYACYKEGSSIPELDVLRSQTRPESLNSRQAMLSRRRKRYQCAQSVTCLPLFRPTVKLLVTILASMSASCADD